LKGFGLEAQQKLQNASVLVIGAGGLGCSSLQYLAAAGIGQIGIVDGDTVAISNLQRQILFETSDIGKSKATTAAKKLQNLNPEIIIAAFDQQINTGNAFALISDYDVVLDCTDNFASRYLINDACVLLKKPIVFGAVFQFEGQVAVFNSSKNSANYRNLFPIPPDATEVQDCNEVGVLGVLPGIIGTLQAVETIKLIAGLEGVLSNRLLTLNLLTYETFIVELDAEINAQTEVQINQAAFQLMDYEWLCGNGKSGIINLSVAEFLQQIGQRDTEIVDVREPGEMPKATFKNQNIPFSEFKENLPEIEASHIVLFCQSGKRSLSAAKMLQQKYRSIKEISHLNGGMIALNEYQNE